MKVRAIVNLCFDQNANYKEGVEEIRGRINILEKEEKVEYHESEAHELRKSDYEKLTEEIRSLRPQKRGTVVARRKFPLPLSNSKKLNLFNTPVLFVRSRTGALEYVFPCLFGETYYNISKGIDHLDASLPNFAPLSGDMEDTIADNFLANLPKYEDGLALLGREMETSAGLADIVLSDKSGKHMIVEVERDATEHALGQVLRLSAGYEKKLSLTRSKVRSAIVCARIHDFMRDAAARADVEIWMVAQNQIN
jgi:hypothetical protein